MIEVERFLLIGCLLQGALGREWAVWVPQSIEALNGSCVLIPCRFEIPSDYDNDLVAEAKGMWKKRHYNHGQVMFNSSISETTPEKNEIDGKLIGDLLMKNCTTLLEHFPSSYSDTYFFRLESNSLLYSFKTGVRINAKDSAPKPKITPDTEVMKGAYVNLSCSAAAPCPKLPPNLTWTPRLGASVDQLQENEDQTRSVSSIMTFAASPLHHGQKITCRALYTLQQGDIQKTSEASLTLRVLYMPQISGSGTCSRTAAEISCSCESRGNPSPSMEWRVSGLRVTNSTDRVIREEQLGNTGLRSSLTMRQSQGDTPTVLCISTSSLGNTSLQLYVPSPQQSSGFSTTSLLIGAAAGVAAGVVAGVVITCCIMKSIQSQGTNRGSQCSGSRRKDTEGNPSPAEDPAGTNGTMATIQNRDPQLRGADPKTQSQAEGQKREELEAMHYVSIKHSPRPVETQGQDACEGAAGYEADVIYSQVQQKRKPRKGKAESGEG